MENTFKARGNWGTLTCCAKHGHVLEYDGEGDLLMHYGDIKRLDVSEWRRQYPGRVLAGLERDILDFGSWDRDGRYVEAEHDWRERRGDVFVENA